MNRLPRSGGRKTSPNDLSMSRSRPPSALLLIGLALLAATGCGARSTGDSHHAAATAWQPVPLETDASFSDLWFADDHNGWMVGGAYDIEGGLIGRTHDGGQTWQFASGFVSRWPGISSFSFTAVQFFDSLAGCTIGSGGQIFLTGDGGANWRLVRSGAGEGLTDLHFIDRNRGWASGGAGVLKTMDGGEHWIWAIRSAYENGYVSGSSIHFVDGWVGWMTRQRQLLKSSDGGERWAAVALPIDPNEVCDLRDVFFLDAYRGWVVGENGMILATTDGGRSWTRCSQGVPAPKPRPLHIVRRQHGIDTFDLEGPPPGLFLTSVRFLDATRGWAVGFFPVEGRSVVLRSEDGGATWREEADAPGEELRGIFLMADGRGWTVGDRVRTGRQALLRRSPVL